MTGLIRVKLVTCIFLHAVIQCALISLSHGANNLLDSTITQISLVSDFTFLFWDCNFQNQKKYSQVFFLPQNLPEETLRPRLNKAHPSTMGNVLQRMKSKGFCAIIKFSRMFPKAMETRLAVLTLLMDIGRRERDL